MNILKEKIAVSEEEKKIFVEVCFLAALSADMRKHREDCPICDKIDVAIKGHMYSDVVKISLNQTQEETLTKVTKRMYKSLGSLTSQLNMPQFPPQGAK